MVEVVLKPNTKKPNKYIQKENEQGDRHFHWRVTSRPHEWRPPTDVLETEETIFVRVEIAGMKDENFSIIHDKGRLTIRGVRPDQAERRAFHQMEIRFGEFRTEVELHWEVDSQAIEAEYRDGFLWVTLPKVKPQTIKIES
jgi:HSP20 family molecular chaperone IbpA